MSPHEAGGRMVQPHARPLVRPLLRPLLWPLLWPGVPRWASREVLAFLAVGGTGYVVDVAVFNLLRSTGPLGEADPSYARVLAVAAAAVVTYLGNRMLTWRGRTARGRRREVALFAFFNLVGLAISVACLVVSHDLLGLTSRLEDNLSANVVGIGLGTLFRFWSYRRFVFVDDSVSPPPAAPAAELAPVA